MALTLPLNEIAIILTSMFAENTDTSILISAQAATQVSGIFWRVNMLTLLLIIEDYK
jgi:hypothetical protein